MSSLKASQHFILSSSWLERAINSFGGGPFQGRIELLLMEKPDLTLLQVSLALKEKK